MSILEKRVAALELKGGSFGNDCIVLARNLFGMGSEAKQIESWRGRNPGIDPKICRVEIVALTEAAA